MPYAVAVAGKGGTGKTTFAALLIRRLIERRRGSILAIDADPNSNLNEALGLAVPQTIADFIEETKAAKPLPAGMTKNMFIEYKLQSAIAESEHVDLLAMGTPEGSGCYCYPNDLLRQHLTNLAQGYDYLVLDNEAGLEHLSRRIAVDVDVMFVISDASARGIRSAGRVREIMKDVKTNAKETYLIVTKVAGDLAPLAEEIEKTGLGLIGTIPLDPQVAQFDLEGRPLSELPAEAPAVIAVNAILDKLPKLS
ncbi:MAG TPA: AAA family ATPase [Bacillota bacterium]|jgi:CO dehydrogenase maturation factor